MRWISTIVLLGLTTLPALATTPVGGEPPERSLLVRCGALIDGLSDEARPATDLLVVGPRFARIGFFS